MASVQELILAAQAKQKKSPLSMLADLINAGSTGYSEGIDLRNKKSESDLRYAETAKKLLEAEQIRKQQDYQDNLRKELADKLATQDEVSIRGKVDGVKAPSNQTTPAGKLTEEFKTDENGNISKTFKVVSPSEDKAPEGYRRTASGNLEYIPGGPADPSNKKQTLSLSEQLDLRDKQKLEREKPKALGSLTNTLREYDNMISEAKAIKDDPSLPDATGLIRTSFIPGSGGKRVAARVETLKSKTLLNVLSSLKSLSANGASGFGALSLPEGEAIKSSISTLDRGLSTKDFQDSIDRFIAEMEARKDTLKSTFENTYNISTGADTQPTLEQSTPTVPNGKISVSNGKETLLIDPADEADALKDGYKRVTK